MEMKKQPFVGHRQSRDLALRLVQLPADDHRARPAHRHEADDADEEDRRDQVGRGKPQEGTAGHADSENLRVRNGRASRSKRGARIGAGVVERAAEDEVPLSAQQLDEKAQATMSSTTPDLLRSVLA